MVKPYCFSIITVITLYFFNFHGQIPNMYYIPCNCFMFQDRYAIFVLLLQYADCTKKLGNPDATYLRRGK